MTRDDTSAETITVARGTQPRGRAASTLGRIRTDLRAHALAVAVAVAVGLTVAWLHWLGLVLGGALVGLAARTPPRALLGGVGFGVVALAVFGVALGGDAWAVLEMAPVVYVTVGAALGLPILGSLVRGVV